MSRLLTTFAKFSPQPKKRILLIATSAMKRELRTRILQKLGLDVDCAADITEARSLWRADFYSLVLMDITNDSIHVAEFCAKIKAAKPSQRVSFLVGKPDYLSASCVLDDTLMVPEEPASPWGTMVAALHANGTEAPPRWGFQEATWQIAATRSLKDPRSKQARCNAKGPRLSWTDAVNYHSKPPAIEAAPQPDTLQKEIL